MTSGLPSLRVAWKALANELDHWAAEGRKAWFWWRDDDAAHITPALERLLAVQRSAAVPLTLAVIPRQAVQALADCLNTWPAVIAVQHGFAHTNNAVSGEKKGEFPPSRPLDARLADLRSGQAIMQRLFPQQHRHVLVPPWNRLPPDMVEHLPILGFSALSGFQLRQRYWAADGLVQCNTHIDPVDWQGNDSIAGCNSGLAAAVRGLQAMRHGVAPQQALGLLTHHLRHDGVHWDFIAEFLDRVLSHSAAGWLNLEDALDLGFPGAAVTPAS